MILLGLITLAVGILSPLIPERHLQAVLTSSLVVLGVVILATGLDAAQ